MLWHTDSFFTLVVMNTIYYKRIISFGSRKLSGRGGYRSFRTTRLAPSTELLFRTQGLVPIKGSHSFPRNGFWPYTLLT